MIWAVGGVLFARAIGYFTAAKAWLFESCVIQGSPLEVQTHNSFVLQQDNHMLGQARQEKWKYGVVIVDSYDKIYGGVGHPPADVTMSVVTLFRLMTLRRARELSSSTSVS